MVSAYHWSVVAQLGTSTLRVSRIGLPTSSDSSRASSSRCSRTRSASFSRTFLRAAGCLVGPAPVVERPPRRGHRPVHVLQAAAGDAGDPPPVPTGDVLERLARGGRHEPAIDEQLRPRIARRPRARASPRRSRGSWRSCGVPLDARRRPGRCPRPGVAGTWSRPSASGRIGSASMKSRRSGVQPGGSYGNSRNGPPPTPAETARLASSPIPFVQVCGVNQRFRAMASSARVRLRDIPAASTTSDWWTSKASASRAASCSAKVRVISPPAMRVPGAEARRPARPRRSVPASGSSTHSTS